MSTVRWVLSNAFCSKFDKLSSSTKKLKIEDLRFDKVTESSKVGTFLRHSVDDQDFTETIGHSMHN